MTMNANTAALDEGQENVLAAEDQARASLYRLLARFLNRPPSQEDIVSAGTLAGDDTPIGVAIAQFGHLCGQTTEQAALQEYHELFVGMVRGEILPYASYYLTGFLHEKPLAKLRKALSELGVERDPNTKEPEDHIAALLDVMAGLIVGDYGEPASIATQKQFFETHIGPWAGYFFTDLEEQETSELYASVGAVGRIFMEVEETAYQMS